MKCLAMLLNCGRQHRERASLRWNIVATVQRCQKRKNSWCSSGRNSRANKCKIERNSDDVMHNIAMLSMFATDRSVAFGILDSAVWNGLQVSPQKHRMLFVCKLCALITVNVKTLLSSSFQTCSLRLLSTIYQQHPPQRPVLGHIHCFRQCEIVGSHILPYGVRLCGNV